MKVMLAISIDYYRTLMAAVLTPEYRDLHRRLINGIIERDGNGNEVVELICDPQLVKTIFDLANRVCSESIPHIQKIIDWLV